MITTKNLPNSYVPYKILNICSNSIKDGGHVLAVGEVLPLVIGKGEKPMIWMQALADSKLKTFVTIVEASVPIHPAVRVYEKSGQLIVAVMETIVLSIENSDTDSAKIIILDLRPLGLNLHGNESVLFVGTSQLSNNSMIGTGTLVKFDL